jgi:REP element-mobilizing transposase RayT
MTFNLDAPPGFRGFDPLQPLTIYTRNLPHWRQAGATYFVTFHLADALPLAKRNELASMRREWGLQNPAPRDETTWLEYAKTAFRMVERWIDAGEGDCWFRQPRYADELRRAILHYHQQRYEIGAMVIMANHCHLTIRPFDGFALEGEIGSIKRIVAAYIHRQEHREGQLWQQESYDRIIRDEEHLYRVVQYIGANPHRANIPRNAWNRWINPQWQSLGWTFHDP